MAFSADGLTAAKRAAEQSRLGRPKDFRCAVSELGFPVPILDSNLVLGGRGDQFRQPLSSIVMRKKELPRPRRSRAGALSGSFGLIARSANEKLQIWPPVGANQSQCPAPLG